MFCLRQVYHRQQRHYDKIKILPQLRSVDAGGIEMYRYQKGFIFNEYTFVVNKEDVRNAKDEDFVEGTALLPEHLFILENQMHGMWELAEHEYEDCAKCSQCAVEFSLTGEWTFEDYLYYMHFCPNCGARMDWEEEE